MIRFSKYWVLVIVCPKLAPFLRSVVSFRINGRWKDDAEFRFFLNFLCYYPFESGHMDSELLKGLLCYSCLLFSIKLLFESPRQIWLVILIADLLLLYYTFKARSRLKCPKPYITAIFIISIELRVVFPDSILWLGCSVYNHVFASTSLNKGSY